MIVKEALDILVPQIVDIYGELLDSIILYGSYARGSEQEDSDVDIAILLKEPATHEMNDRVVDFVVDMELETGKVLSVLKIDLNKYTEWVSVLPFYKNIHDEGICLWKAA